VERELFPREPKATRAVRRDAPLAERMRPRSLEEFEGQEHLLGEGGPLGPVLAARGKLPSCIFWGPPGSGKTTLARLLAERAGLRFAAISAVLSGVKDLREEIARAEEALGRGERTALFIDEIHRFNKAQQDALLPHVERGTVVLLGATTENPSFEVIPALRSRARIFTLKALDEALLGRIVTRALEDRERGLGERGLSLAPEALELIARLAQGDARRALGLLESAAERATGTRIERDHVAAAFEARVPDYDKGGEAHYDVISAFIKSLRGSDPDAAVYWLARMLEGGEEPRFILRRLMIFASEDVGREAVKEHGALPGPLAIRNAPTQLLRELGYGKGYQYPHDFPGHFVREQYLPDKLRDAEFYAPSDQGAERETGERQRKRWEP
jgi:putative ATPase